jgi:hypothetical protein
MQPKQAVALMQATATPSNCKVKQSEQELDGYGIVTVTVGANASECTLLLATIDLAQHIELAGQVVYMLVQANITLPDTSVALSIDGADGTGRHISADWDEAPNAWRMLEYQLSETSKHVVA